MIGVTIAIFLLMRLIPGDVVEQILGAQSNITEGQRAALRAYFGLDQPLYVQYWNWASHAAVGDLGTSWRNAQPVLQLILFRLPVTAELTALAMLIALLIGIPTGMISAVRQGSRIDNTARVVSLLGLSIPDFWQGTMLILLFSLAIHWIPSTDYVGIFEKPLVNLSIMILPALSLGTVASANVSRLTRSSMLETLRKDYVRTARAKGLQERAVIWMHALRNSLIPVVTVIGLQVGYLLGGAVVIEEVFTLPGVGRMVLEAIYQRDYPLVQGSLIFIAFFFVVVNIVVDVLYAYIDPRIRLT
jgi:peptide/nickel transport system permease protein